ncbi:MAG: Gram-negative bacterial TonB protein C-terminal [Verrucomicrobiota bacterium]|jgi:TonB family protein
MAKPILYQPPPKKLVWGALGCAVFIYVGAVVAAMKHEPPPVDLSDIPTASVEAMLTPAEEQPTPPPEDIPVPEPPPMPDIKPEFVEESTPPPKRPQQAKAAPIKAPQAIGRPPGSMSISGAKAVATFAPKPDYPYEARSRHITGSGVCVLTIDVASGSVTDATMAQSVGNPILDNATISGFRRWRFKAGAAAPKVKVPITFTMSGASY